MTWYNQCTKLSSSALELMILHCTILLSSNWAPIFFLFSNALGMLFPLWDGEYIPIRKMNAMEAFFNLSASTFPYPMSSLLWSHREKGQKPKSKCEWNKPYCTRCKCSGYLLGCKCSVTGAISLLVCTVATTLHTWKLAQQARMS